VVAVANDYTVANLHLIRLHAEKSSHENFCVFTTALLHNYSKHAPTPSDYFKRQALMTYGCELVTRLEFYTWGLDIVSKEQLLDAGVRSLTAAGDSEKEIDYSILKVPDDDFRVSGLDIVALVCPGNCIRNNSSVIISAHRNGM
jgi:hypothetical protein